MARSKMTEHRNQAVIENWRFLHEVCGMNVEEAADRLMMKPSRLEKMLRREGLLGDEPSRGAGRPDQGR